MPASAVKATCAMKAFAATKRVPMEFAAASYIAAVDIAVVDVLVVGVAMANKAAADVAAAFISMDPTAAIRPIRMTVPWTTPPPIGPSPVA